MENTMKRLDKVKNMQTTYTINITCSRFNTTMMDSSITYSLGSRNFDAIRLIFESHPMVHENSRRAKKE